MRKLFPLALLGSLLGGCTAEPVPQAWEGLVPEGRAHVEQRLAEIADTPEPESGVLFVGDSITEGADLAVLFPGVAVSNHGIGWDTTQGVLARLDQITRGEPERVFLLIGTNDLGYGISDRAVADSVLEVARRLSETEPQAEIYLQGLLPREEDMAARVAAINSMLEVSATDAGAAYLEPGVWLEGKAGALQDGLSPDGLHLNAEGYARWARAIESCVRDGCSGGRGVTWVGRVAHTDEGLALGWPGSGFAVRADGPISVEMEDSGRNVFDVIVDGKASQLELEAGRNIYVLNRTDGVHDIIVTRRSESFESGLTQLVSIEGKVSPLPLPEKRMLFIGDSITAGFGVLGADETCGYSAETSSVRDAYAGRVADTFGADAHFVAISGRGAVYNYGDDPRPNMLGNFDLALPDTPIPWDHGSWTPDVVVVALGTNDWSTNDPGTTFAGNYTALLTRIGAEYPNAKIIAVTGPLLDGEKGQAIADGVAEAIARVADDGISVRTVALELAEEGHVYGCSYHPGTDSVARMAETLSAVIEEETGWTR